STSPAPVSRARGAWCWRCSVPPHSRRAGLVRRPGPIDVGRVLLDPAPAGLIRPALLLDVLLHHAAQLSEIHVARIRDGDSMRGHGALQSSNDFAVEVAQSLAGPDVLLVFRHREARHAAGA